MNINKVFVASISFVLLCGCMSCGHSAGEIADIVSERDSLRNENKRQQRKLDNLDNIVQIVNGNIDSIAAEESNLFAPSSKEGGPVTKDQVLKNLSRLENLINNQKKRIAELENNMKQDDEQSGEEPDNQLVNLVASLKKQILQKDAQIAKLKEDLNKKDVDISRLQAQSAQQMQTISELDRRSKMQQEALKRQDAALNQCYMAIGTKKVLESKGIIKKGKIVPSSALDRSKFTRVDIRKFTEFSFEAKRPRILTPVPESAYEITTNDRKTYTISITNPGAFWSVSNFLIIQTN